MDEMSSPTTASPAGLLCMTAVCVFTGRGLVGQILVSTAAFIHLGLVIWFIYMALAYNILPEPSKWHEPFGEKVSISFNSFCFSATINSTHVIFYFRLVPEHGWDRTECSKGGISIFPCHNRLIYFKKILSLLLFIIFAIFPHNYLLV